MSKVEDPTLFQIVFARRCGFHSLDLMHQRPHYVRVVAETSGSLVIEALPFDLLARARMYKAKGRNSTWWIEPWWEDEFLAQRIRTFVFDHIGSLDQVHTFHVGADNNVSLKGR